MDFNRGFDKGPRKPLNPYESPQAPPPRGPLLVRLARATRRGWAAYWGEIRRSRLTVVEHFGAWLSLTFAVLIVAAICVAIVVWFVLGMLGEL